MSATSRRRPLPPIKTCPYGCRYANTGWHMENCPGPPAFLSEPEYQREREDDDRDRRHEAYEDQRLSHPEKGLASE